MKLSNKYVDIYLYMYRLSNPVELYPEIIEFTLNDININKQWNSSEGNIFYSVVDFIKGRD